MCIRDRREVAAAPQPQLSVDVLEAGEDPEPPGRRSSGSGDAAAALGDFIAFRERSGRERSRSPRSTVDCQVCGKSRLHHPVKNLSGESHHFVELTTDGDRGMDEEEEAGSHGRGLFSPLCSTNDHGCGRPAYTVRSRRYDTCCHTCAPSGAVRHTPRCNVDWRERLRAIQERAVSGLPSARGKGPRGRGGRGKGRDSPALSAWRAARAREEPMGGWEPGEEDPPDPGRRGSELLGTEAPCPEHGVDSLACMAVHCDKRVPL